MKNIPIKKASLYATAIILLSACVQVKILSKMNILQWLKERLSPIQLPTIVITAYRYCHNTS